MQKFVEANPDLLNEVVIEIYKKFHGSDFIDGEMKNILGLYSRKKEYIYKLKPEAVTILIQHPSKITRHFPIIE